MIEPSSSAADEIMPSSGPKTPEHGLQGSRDVLTAAAQQ
jgi:hypothetical protein